jgi:hypothetical protein
MTVPGGNNCGARKNSMTYAPVARIAVAYSKLKHLFAKKNFAGRSSGRDNPRAIQARAGSSGAIRSIDMNRSEEPIKAHWSAWGQGRWI